MSELHDPCSFVEREVGSDPELMQAFFEDRDLVEQTADLIELTYSRSRNDIAALAMEQRLGIHESARRALATLA